MLCLVVDRRASLHRLPELVEESIAAGVDWLQIRERELDTRSLLSWSRVLISAAQRAGRRVGREVKVVVNRRLDLALALDADGVHLGFDALGVPDARALLGDRAWIGVSAHRPEEVHAARRAGASYAQLAPIYAPLSKRSTRPALGLEPLRMACKAGLPVLAQGGVEASRCAALLAAGAAGVAVTGAISMADDPQAATRALRSALDAAGAPDSAFHG